MRSLSNIRALYKEFYESPKLLEKDTLLELLDTVDKLLKSEGQLLRVEAASVLFVGDTHGDIDTTRKALGSEADVKIFLGDYVDRGKYQLENIELLFLAKLAYPEKIFLLRGNHETTEMNEIYGFQGRVLEHYDYEVYQRFEEVFSSLSLSAVVNQKFFAVHGGIAIGLKRLEEIERIPKGPGSLNSEIAFQMLWNDPGEEIEEFAPSPRGWGIYLYGRKPVEEFLENNGLEVLVRAHEPFPEGFREFFSGKLISIFSCRFYPITEPRGLLLRNNERKIISLA
ncbi:MAG: metallophosphoesterase [Infirmifilum sp.]